MSSPYDPTQPVPPPIEPTRLDESVPPPPPPPLIPSELPYFQEARARREQQRARSNRIIIVSLITLLVVILAVTIPSVLSSTLFASPQQSGPTASDYHTWLNQEKQVWQSLGYPVVYAAFAEPDFHTLNLATLNADEQTAADICRRTANDYVARFHASIRVQMTDNENAYFPFPCTASP